MAMAVFLMGCVIFLLEYFIKMIRREENAESHTERSLNAMKLMDELRRQCGITFPADER